MKVRHDNRKVKLGRGSGLPVMAMTTQPKAWWPQLPGKSTPPGWHPSWKPTFDEVSKTFSWGPRQSRA
jgi:hypothetical protein